MAGEKPAPQAPKPGEEEAGQAAAGEGAVETGKEGQEAPEPGDALGEAFDYGGVIDDKDLVDFEGEKITYAEAKKRNALYKKLPKDVLDKLEKDPEYLNKLATTGTEGAQGNEGNQQQPEILS